MSLKPGQLGFFDPHHRFTTLSSLPMTEALSHSLMRCKMPPSTRRSATTASSLACEMLAEYFARSASMTLVYPAQSVFVTSREIIFQKRVILYSEPRPCWDSQNRHNGPVE